MFRPFFIGRIGRLLFSFGRHEKPPANGEWKMVSGITQKTISSKTRQWLKTVAPFNRDHLTLEPTRAALLVVDMQNYFLAPGAPAYLSAGTVILPAVKKLIAAFRASARPVIFTRHAHHPDGHDAGIMKWWWDKMCTDGTPESEIHPEISPLASELVLTKCRYSAFFRTDLETILRSLKVEDLVIAGVMTNLCCESTARDAYYRNFRVFFPADGTAAKCEEMHVGSLMNLAYGFAVITTIAKIIDQVNDG